MNASEIIAAARAELGTPFRHQGRLPGVALDCAGLCVLVAQRWHAVCEPAAYSRTPHGDTLRQWVERQPYLERAAAPQAGDVLLMRFAREPQHLALCAGDTIIHSYESIGRVVEHRLDDVWRRRIVAVYRFREVQA